MHEQEDFNHYLRINQRVGKNHVALNLWNSTLWSVPGFADLEAGVNSNPASPTLEAVSFPAFRELGHRLRPLEIQHYQT